MSTTLQTLPRKPAERFAAIVELLRRSLAARGPKGFLAAPLLRLLWSRLGRLIRRFASLAARIEAGTLARPRPRPHRPRSGPTSPPPRLPRRFAWLIGPVPEANIVRSQLDYLLAQPDMAAVLAAPQIGRILRPLCHMLGLKPPPALRLPRRPPGIARPAPAARPAPRPAPAPGSRAAAPPDRGRPRHAPPPPVPPPRRRSGGRFGRRSNPAASVGS